ncbi:hypothetical protein [Paenibacillus humicola]|uniref:hypothetical protein n=1 Tax=Paenibacillus humicola TaxID=3110540 RepID=UPI00237A4509|nr:hypothetical protein [Paenibacillus humicola]
MNRAFAWFGLLMLAVLLYRPGEASANSLFEHQQTTVPEGQTIDDVYVIGNDAEISGHATGAVVVINGSLHLASTARVDGVVVVIGGRISQDPGSALGDDIYHFSLDTATQNSLFTGGGLAAGVWAVELAGSLLLLLIPITVRFIGGRRAADAIRRQAELPWRRRLYLGAVSGVILAAFSVLCVVTLIGIPLLIVVAAILAAAMVMGLTILSYQLGGLLKESLIPTEWIRLTAGALFISAGINIPLVGWLAFLFLTLLSLGSLTQWLFTLRRRKSLFKQG